MSPDTSNFVSINNITSPSGRQEFYVHQFQDENGKASKLVYTGDGVGDVNKVAQQYIEQGFDPSKIKINGQLASDVFGAQGAEKTNNSSYIDTTNLTGFEKFKAKCHNFINGVKSLFKKTTVDKNDMNRMMATNVQMGLAKPYHITEIKEYMATR